MRFLACLLLSCTCVFGTDIIPTDWRVNWASGPAIRYSGPRNTNDWITHAVLASGSTAAQINSAISTAPTASNCIVRLQAGTYTLTARLTIGHSNVRLVGDGPTTTRIIAGSGIASGAIIEVGVGGAFPPTFVRNWTAGYAKDTTGITLASTNNIDVGDMLILTQTGDSSGLVNGAGDEGPCTDCSGAIQNAQKTLQHHARVSGFTNGGIVAITPGLLMTNWGNGTTPQAYNYSSITTNVVIDDLWIDNSASAIGEFGIRYQNFADGWVNRVFIDRAANRHITTLHCAQIEVTDSMFKDSESWSTHSYGFAPYNCTGFWCVNNIFWGVTGVFKPTSANYGVFAYNYATNILFLDSAPWLQAPVGNHGSHCDHILYEGNILPSIRLDNVHGSGSHNVIFRNRIRGQETNRTDNSMAIALQATNRCMVIAGNVLGLTNFHTQWRLSYPSSGSSSIKAVEEYGYIDVGYDTFDGDTLTFSSAIITHNQVSQTLNGGTNGGVYWATGYGSDLQLESSYIYSSKPDWWGCSNFPSIGPDLLSLCTNDVAVFVPAKVRFNTGNYFTNLVDTCGQYQKKLLRSVRLEAR